MITPQEIDNKRFEAEKNGYSTDEVDEFLKEISASVSQMQREKEETDKKMAFLVETVKKYKQDEEALKDAMIFAQKQSKEIIEEAKKKAEEIVAEAHVKSEEIIGSTSTRLDTERAAFDTLKAEVADFRTNLLNMYREHLGLINSIPGLDEEEEYAEAADTAAEPAAEAETV